MDNQLPSNLPSNNDPTNDLINTSEIIEGEVIEVVEHNKSLTHQNSQLENLTRGIVKGIVEGIIDSLFFYNKNKKEPIGSNRKNRRNKRNRNRCSNRRNK